MLRALRLPLVTLLLTVLAGLLMFAGYGDAAEYDRAAIAAGEFWRLATGHVTHWNFEHLAWDVLMFALLGVMIERRSRRDLAAALILSAVSISGVLWLCQEGVGHYRGLSGIDSALFTFLAIDLLRDARRQNQNFLAAAIVAALLGFAGKIGYEMATGATLFVDSPAAGFVPLPLVHVIGGASGLLAAGALAPRRSPQLANVRQINCPTIT
jgi:rhomboid family GlyGly-CTERM serine protease